MKKIYSDCKVYGPYVNREGRDFMFIVYPDGKRESTQLSRYAMERRLNRKLTNREEVHHKDKNFNNNRYSNLEIVDATEHRKSHVTRRPGKYLFCHTCGLIFWVTGKQLHGRGRNKSGFNFCSRKCSGIFTRIEQIKQGKINLRIG